MYNSNVLGLAEAEAAVKAVFAEAAKDPARPVSVAVVDSAGNIITASRADGAAWNTMVMALKKAYTAAKMRRDTRAIGQLIQSQGYCDLGSSFGADLTLVPGGQTIVEEGGTVSYGGIGLSGRKASEDEVLAIVGLKAIQTFLKSSK